MWDVEKLESSNPSYFGVIVNIYAFKAAITWIFFWIP